MPPDNQNQGHQGAELKVVMARGIVARGRQIEVPNTKKRVLAYTHPENGKAMFSHEMMVFGEGAEVELSEDEIVSLRARGFLVDPAKIVQPQSEGSHVKEVGGQTKAA